jgi:hypothetical protein
LAWYQEHRELFEFGGGRVLSNAFPNCTAEFADELVKVVKAGGQIEADFSLAIIRNYQGEKSTHGILKEIVSRFFDDQQKVSAVEHCIDSTGVVMGELGFADAYRKRQELMTDWLNDERRAVKEFAQKHLKSLSLQIAQEHRRAESSKEMWRREFQDDEESESAEDNE